MASTAFSFIKNSFQNWAFPVCKTRFDPILWQKTIISSCFYSAPDSTKLAELILFYLDEDLKHALMGSALQNMYRKRNQQDIFKLKPLQIVRIRTESQHDQLAKTLMIWDKIADQELDKLKGEVQKVKRIDSALCDRIALLSNYHFLIELTKTSEYASYLKTVVINEQSKIEAVSYSAPDALSPKAHHIHCLLSAPWNQIEKQRSVKGAGSALIEHAALQSLKQQEIDPPDSLSHSLLKKAMVTLIPCGPAYSFYIHLFFVHRDNEKIGMVLTGESMVKFFERFGGRAECKRGAIEI